MFKFMFALALGAAAALSASAALPQTSPATTMTKPHAHAHRPTGSFRSEMNRRNNMSKAHARASAEHMRTMRMQKQ
ncbi:MAG: hypothetical protein JO288_16025 [Hyphomicrobiales bacterium]|nr:hypothetical protein [Hyphomicrobiales bacterium]